MFLSLGGLTEICLNDMIHSGFRFWQNRSHCFADVAELADAPDLGSGAHGVQVQVLSSALKKEYEGAGLEPFQAPVIRMK